jgi:hypothetical protein
MQRLEVSCAVRPIYGSLGPKGLIVRVVLWFHLDKSIITSFYECWTFKRCTAAYVLLSLTDTA